MALATELPGKRFRCFEFPWLEFVLLGRFVTADAWDVDVLGEGFRVGNFPVAGIAILGCLRRLRIVWFVAADAGLHRIV